MSRRLNWEPLRLSHKRKLNIKDEQEWLDSGYTARWLEEAEEREARSRFPHLTPRPKAPRKRREPAELLLHPAEYVPQTILIKREKGDA